MANNQTLFLIACALLIAVSQAQKGTTLAGYKFATDASAHASLEKDVKQMEKFAKTAKVAKVLRWYTKGGNFREDGGVVTLQSLSREIEDEFLESQIFKTFSRYWKSDRYADNFILAALRGRGSFQGLGLALRTEAAITAVKLQNVWMWIVQELDETVEDCEAGAGGPGGAAPGVIHLDHAWAFYAGDSEGSSGGGNGVMIHGVADELCGEFRTCTNGGGRRGKAKANRDIVKFVNAFASRVKKGNCDQESLIDIIIPKMTIPAIQGAILSAYRADPEGGNAGAAARGAAWGYATSALPLVAKCSSNAARDIIANLDVKNNRAVPDGYAKVANSFFKVLRCLGLTCSDIGDLRVNGRVVARCST